MSKTDGDCRHLLGDLSAYLDGDATADLCAEIERHVRECDDCRVVVDTLRKTITLYRELPVASISADMRARLYHALNLDDYLAA